MMMVVVIVCLSGTIFAAEIDIPELEMPVYSGLNLNGYITFPDLKGHWGASNQKNDAYAFTHLSLMDHVLLSGSWDFHVLKGTSRWEGNLSLNGILWEREKLPSNSLINQRLNLERQGITLRHWLSVDYSDEWLLIDGSISVAPAEIISIDFQYGEHKDWENPLVTRWNINLNIQGEFIAKTAEEARALGAKFASVPEPTTIFLLGLGGTILSLRRRRKR